MLVGSAIKVLEGVDRVVVEFPNGADVATVEVPEALGLVLTLEATELELEELVD